MIIKKAIYKTSVTEINKILKDFVPEFAFVGRSNAGKSSLINCLTNTKSLAKTSSTPGKTKMINYFDINESFRFVDLPGYGFAKVGKSQLDVWSSLIGKDLTSSPSLVTVFLLVDIRHKPSQQDKQMVEFMIYHDLPFVLIATKADKIARSKISQQTKMIAKELKVREEVIISFSSQTGQGKDRLLDYIENKLGSLDEYSK